ncbi:MAG: GMC family oxidoreductase N-terminal domain-containing protein [Roseibium sp.]|nr:GMC family oxidoreductase N-terminal domain-containing protein [Roseibium sp.]
MERFDYIVVGGGSAGCILAERLSHDPATSVLLLEAGGTDASPLVSIPLGYGPLHRDPRRTWRFETAPEAGLNDRRLTYPRGRLIGGSGSINALVYCRGLPSDYDDWAEAGAEGWAWRDVEPVFERLETKVAASGARSGNGPIHVQDVSDRIHPVTSHFFAAIDELRLPRSQDCNGARPEGATAYHINTRDGRRCSSAKAFLGPARNRRNLKVITKAVVRRLLMSDRTATGVELIDGRRFSAGHEVILSTGAIGSPQILHLSGIGPGQVLNAHGIDVICDNGNVGGHLQDHLCVSYTFEAKVPTLNTCLGRVAGLSLAVLRYLARRGGPLALSVNQCGGFLRSAPELARPDQQLYFNPISYRMRGPDGRSKLVIDPFEGFVLCAQPARPTSRGRVDIASADPENHPRIQPNYLSTEEDRAAAIGGARLCQKITRTKALHSLVKQSISHDLTLMAKDDLLEDFQNRGSTVFHPVGTCRMGRDPATSVVDPTLKVHGIERLRVVDASAFPNITSGNTNAPTMMLALKAADLIVKDRTGMTPQLNTRRPEDMSK